MTKTGNRIPPDDATRCATTGNRILSQGHAARYGKRERAGEREWWLNQRIETSRRVAVIQFRRLSKAFVDASAACSALAVNEKFSSELARKEREFGVAYGKGVETSEGEGRKRRWREYIQRITNELRDSIKHLPDALLRVVAEGLKRGHSAAGGVAKSGPVHRSRIQRFQRQRVAQGGN